MINHCESTVEAGGRCFIAVVFSPGASGMRTATLTITDSGIGSPHVVPLSGVGEGLGLGSAPGASNSATINAGQVAHYMLSIGNEGFTGTAMLTCSGMPPQAFCKVPPSINVMSLQATPFTVSVSTTGQSAKMTFPARHAPLAWLWAMAIVGLVILPSASLASPMKGSLWWLPRSLPLWLLLLICSCGGGSGAASGGGGGGTGSGGTPSGTYTPTVTATSGSMMQSVELKLIVQ